MKYVSLLRGINVSGQKKIKMADLKVLYESLGFDQVVTYLQSGNVVFETDSDDKKALGLLIETVISDQYGFDVPVDIRTNSELNKIIKACPYDEARVEENGSKILISFFQSTPAGDREGIQGYIGETEKFSIIDDVAYLYCPNGYGKTKLSNSFLEKKLGVTATTRNWKSVNKLFELSC